MQSASKSSTKRYCFRHAGLEERIFAVVIARKFGMREIDAWRRWVEFEDLPNFFHDFAKRAREEAVKFIEENPALPAKARARNRRSKHALALEHRQENSIHEILRAHRRNCIAGPAIVTKLHRG